MKHQPFETWILLDDPLTPEQTRALNLHLQTCEECRQLKSAWGRVDLLFQDAPAFDPVTGFAERWQTRLHQERSLTRNSRYRWQSWITLILIANAVSVLAVVLGVQVFSSFGSFTDILIAMVYRLTSLLAILSIFQDILVIAVRTLPGLLPPAGWASIAIAVSAGSLLWVFSIFRLAKIPWRVQQ